MKCESIHIDQKKKDIIIYVNDAFASQVFTPDKVDYIYNQLSKRIPKAYKKYKLFVKTAKHATIEQLIPNIYRTDEWDKQRMWKDLDYKGNPWVKNLSLPYEVTNGLQNRHLFIWASHGNYFKENQWKWQRPYLFCTTEDLFTQSFVYPFLFPMLEKAGAIIGTPRERDYQTQQIIVDNNIPSPKDLYTETTGKHAWETSAEGTGFGEIPHVLNDSINPFSIGTYRYISTTSQPSKVSTAIWEPNISIDGKYAVYVSYKTLPNSITDAHYTVYHKGGHTDFTVNQQMGGGTWVYLGTFEFGTSHTSKQYVVLHNHSKNKGIVTADAVRFGGGMGQHERGGIGCSGLPRYLEAARYYAQWAGIPDTLVNTSEGMNDYADDLRVRGNMLNYLGGGSIYMPNIEGQRVPFEIALALHSDAGIRSDHSIFGSLSIGTTQVGDSMKTYPVGLSRYSSSDFSAILLNDLTRNISTTFSIPWVQREHWDRNYAETRIPHIPSAILEMLSHQNFRDMTYGHDPHFKFTLARSVYKSILRYVMNLHDIKKYSIQPLPIRNFAAELTEDGSHVHLSWDATTDALEPTAKAKQFVLYTKVGDGAFDNGQNLGDCNSCLVKIHPHTPYAFQITAVNDGGESFPSETLSAYFNPQATKRALIVNGFYRLSGPAQVNHSDCIGFDVEEDFGVPYLSTTAYSGKQEIFNVNSAGLADSIAWGLSGQEWVGKELKGNTFDYPVTHGKAMIASNQFSYGSISRNAFEQPGFNTQSYDVIDYIAGLEGDFKHNLRPFKTFTSATQNKLTQYLHQGGALFLSGSYIASDCLHNQSDRSFIENILKFRYAGSARNDTTLSINGLNMNFEIFRTPNEIHYPAQNPDAILPSTTDAFPCFMYGLGQGAGVAYPGKDYRVISMSFPFECIRNENIRKSAMNAILTFLTER